MKNRTKRLFSIKRIIGTEEISSQEVLAARLKRAGIRVSQSTLSRDLRELNVAKSSDNGCYFVPENKEISAENTNKTKQHGLTGSIKSIDFSGNISVIKTLPGYANAVTAVIDNSASEEILGTIAGDDTIFIVTREDTAPEYLVQELTSLFPSIAKLHKK